VTDNWNNNDCTTNWRRKEKQYHRTITHNTGDIRTYLRVGKSIQGVSTTETGKARTVGRKWGVNLGRNARDRDWAHRLGVGKTETLSKFSKLGLKVVRPISWL
jgi:hypothetical protein